MPSVAANSETIQRSWVSSAGSHTTAPGMERMSAMSSQVVWVPPLVPTQKPGSEP